MMSVEIKIIYLIVYLIEALIFLQYVSAIFKPKYKKYIELPVLFTLYVIFYIIFHFNNIFLNTVVFFLSNFLYILFMYYTNIQLSLFHAAISTVIMTASELIVYSIISYYTPDFCAETRYFLHMLLLAIFSKFVYFLVLYLLSHLFCAKEERTSSNQKSTLFLSLIPLTTLFVLITLFSVSARTTIFFSIDVMLCISATFMLGLNLFIFAFHHYIQKENLKHTELKLLLQKEYDSTEYYKMLLKQTENQKILIHDMKKHLQSIAILNENKETEKIASYIHHLIHSSSLQNHSHFCEHKLLNSILGQYKKQCDEKQIEFLVDVRHKTVDFMLPNDLTALFCNLLDNAVEAAEKTVDSFIELYVSQKERTPYTVVTITNTCRRDPFEHGSLQLLTSKKDKQHHGYGLKSIQKAVKKYHGNMKMYYEKDTTTFHTIITLKPQENNSFT